jgi:creatinine amidohydrolase
MNRGGSLTLDFDTLRAFVRCVALSLRRQGYRRILLLNGHGGNMAALVTIVDSLAVELELPLATATYWNVAAPAFHEILEAQSNLLHACEAETSMMMHLRPDLVDAQAARSLQAPRSGFLQPNGFHRWHGMDYWSRCGVVGVPAKANADKGRRLLDAAASALASHLSDGAPWNESAGS